MWEKFCELSETQKSETSFSLVLVGSAERCFYQRNDQNSAPPGCSGVSISWGAVPGVCPEGRVWNNIMCKCGHWLHTTQGNNFLVHYPGSAPTACIVYAKEKEKFTFQDKMVLSVKQSYCFCNSSFNSRGQLEPGTCCLQKCHVM